MKVLIVEDELIIADHLKAIVKKGGLTCVGVAVDIEAAKRLLAKKPDLVLLDIKLSNNDSGITFGKFLNEQHVPFFYITANNELDTMQEALKTKPLGYLSKPFNANDILAAFVLLQDEVKERGEKIWVRSGGGKFQIPVIDIMYAEAQNVYVHIYTKTKTWTQRMTLKEFEEELSDPSFVKIHRSFIINKRHIAGKSSTHVWIGEVQIPISITYKDVLD